MAAPINSPTAFPILRRPAGRALPVLVTIPHFGEQALPGFDPTTYATDEFIHFARGFADPFAAAIYGELHRCGATVLASPYSRLFVDLNRARDDFKTDAGRVASHRGVVRTHTRSGRAVFQNEHSLNEIENRLQRFYDPYHDRLNGLIEGLTSNDRRLALIDAHTALAERFGDREVVVGTQRGKTASGRLARMVGDCFAAAGFRVDYDVSGYAGGYTVRSYGKSANRLVDAIQVEVGLTTLLEMPRMQFIEATKRGESPQPCSTTIAALRACMSKAVEMLAHELG